MKENDTSCGIRGVAFKVHTALWPGLLESVYEIALAFELRGLGYNIKMQLVCNDLRRN
ncbi:MAG: GxxExxY protein [Cyclobacteriaceae bacterium]